jgi:CYTH domain-containing protein
MRALANEMDSPKYAHIERERRWLVDPGARPPLDGLPFVAIDDRYIRGTRLRLRRMADGTGGTGGGGGGAQSLKLTKKYACAEPLARPIVTAYLTQAEYDLLATLSADTLAKRRYRIAEQGVEWSLDVFAGPLDGLEQLECEAADGPALAALQPPFWATREVTADPRFEGATLAAHSLPEEQSWRPS